MKNLPIEYEAKFLGVIKDQIRQKLTEIGALLKRPEFIQKRIMFHFPSGHEIEGGRIRVRDEGDKITMSVKVSGKGMTDQKEIYLEVNDLTQAEIFLTAIGCQKNAYIESKRELWLFDEAQITIDEWPFLDPYVEIEANSEKEVKQVAEQLGFDYQDAVFGSASQLYTKKYGVSENRVNNETSEITFSSKNPFLD